MDWRCGIPQHSMQRHAALRVTKSLLQAVLTYFYQYRCNRAMTEASKGAKRPAEDNLAAAELLGHLGQSLGGQISTFEKLGEVPPEHAAKKPSKVGSAAPSFQPQRGCEITGERSLRAAGLH